MADTKPASGMPLPDAMAGNFQEAVRWFNQLWAGVADGGSAAHGGPIPSVLMPTLDIKEIDKRIADLRSVEHWLQLNQGLLHSTIQGLEMQRNTLSAWQSFGAAAVEGAGGGLNPGASATGSSASAMAAFQPAIWWATLQQQFAQMAASAAAGEKPEATGDKPEPAAAAEAARVGPGKPKSAGASKTGGAGSGNA